MYSIVLEYSPVYELVSSFYTFINQKQMKGNLLGANWVNDTLSKLPQKFANELEDERWELLHRTVLLIHECPVKHSVEGFLQWFQELPPGEIYERLSPWVNNIPLNFLEIRDRSVYLLSEWNEHYFKSIDPLILQKLELETSLRSNQVNEETPMNLIEEATDGLVIDPSDKIQKVILVPQYHCSPSTILDFFRGVVTCLYPFNKIHNDMEESKLETMAQCLSDKRRLQILGFIAEGPRSLKEVQNYTNLAKSTVHHHLFVLRRSGMIRAHYIDQTTVAYYSLRDKIIEKVSIELAHLIGRKHE